MKEIKYIGFYDTPKSGYERVSSLAAINKMDYICDALNRANYSVHIVSPSWFKDSIKQLVYQPSITEHINNQKHVTFCPNFGAPFWWMQRLRILFSLSWLFIWLLFNVKRKEKIIIYHVPWLSIPVRCAKLIKGYKIILEVEEIYGDVLSIHSFFNTLESKMLSAANSYLLATELLAKRIINIKPYVVIHGVYLVNEQLAIPPSDGKIHLLYSGIIDNEKGGAFNAVECARYLSDKYILHIIGFGENEKLKIRIEEINEISQCKIVFDGIKTGIEFVKYCQSCHIGLSTQKMSGKYLESSFPSKILSYLCMGLNVVSCRIQCVVDSNINTLINYYDSDDPKEIASVIMSIILEDQNKIKSKIKLLDEQFLNELVNLLNL